VQAFAKKRPGAVRVRSFLSWAFVISIAVHFTCGSLIRFKPTYEPEPIIHEVSITHVTPPTPKPTEPPTPPPKQTPPPVAASQPPQHALRVHPPITHQHGAGPLVAMYSPSPVGDETGAPSGNGTASPSAVVASAAPTLAPTPVVTPVRPSCAAPHADARAIVKAEPDYPPLAQAQGAAGTASVRVSLSETGAVIGADIYKSTGNGALDREALKAARNSRYSPEIEDCRKVPGRYLFVVDFTSQ
jgi:protein TonB